MAKIHAIEKELLEALKVKAQGAKEKRPTFLKRLHEAATECEEKVWDQLTEEAQGWVNEATTAADKDKDIPDFAGEAKEAEAEAEAEAAKKPAKGKKEAKAAKPAKAAAEKPAKAEKAAKSEKSDKATKASNGKAKEEAGYKGHRAGSRKETIHKLFDEKGDEAAIKKAVALGLSEGSAKSWIGAWKRAAA